MKMTKLAAVISATVLLAACNGDDNDGDIRRLNNQINDLNEQIAAADSASTETIASLESQITALETQLSANETASAEEISEMEAELETMRAQLDALQAQAPQLGSNATQGANVLPEDSDRVWRFAVFPDTQGRDDDNMRMTVSVDCDGNSLSVEEYVGVDFNEDGFYDGGTESQALNVKPGDPDEDGISYLVDVSDPFHPCIVTEAGEPVVVAPEDRQDYGPDWKIVPKPLVEAVTDKMIELDVDLVLSIGDVTEYRAESDYVQWMEIAAEPLREAGIELFPVRGNHEIVNGRNWPAWFTNEQEWERQSVNNVYNDINPYDGLEQVDFDQGYRLYQSYIGAVTSEHINNGRAIGFPGFEDLVYYFVNDNTLFVALDVYFAELHSSAYRGHWTILRDWITEVITSNAADVDHIVVFGHEPLSTKKRPQTYEAEIYEEYTEELRALQSDVDAKQAAYDQAVADAEPAERLAALQVSLEEAQGNLEEAEQPSLNGYDLGQLGFLLLQDQAEPGLAEDLLSLFTEYQVTYISGHDHQYARSLIHPSPEHIDSTHGFTQIIGGNASWKAYENEYGINQDRETGLFLNNFYDRVSGGDLTNSLGEVYANVTSSLGNGISFVLVEVNGRQITTKAYFADHTLTEVDMNLGAHYDYDTNSWCTFSGDFLVDGGAATTENCAEVDWQIMDENTRTTDATKRIVAPKQNYFATTQASAEDGYIGSEASIIDGYNLTFNSSYAASVDRIESLRELLSLSWFIDNDSTSLSDVLWISGNQTQEGSLFDQYGEMSEILVDVDNGAVAEGDSPSLNYTNHRGHLVANPTHSTRDGVMTKGTDLEASLNPDLANGNPGGNSANWTDRYLDNGLDFADAMTLVFQAPEGTDIETLTVGRYDEATESWVQAFPEECYTESGYSEHFSVYYRISEQHPEGGFEVGNCQQRYWGYTKDSNTIWGFIHTDGKFAVIER